MITLVVSAGFSFKTNRPCPACPPIACDCGHPCPSSRSPLLQLVKQSNIFFCPSPPSWFGVSVSVYLLCRIPFPFLPLWYQLSQVSSINFLLFLIAYAFNKQCHFPYSVNAHPVKLLFIFPARLIVMPMLLKLTSIFPAQIFLLRHNAPLDSLPASQHFKLSRSKTKFLISLTYSILRKANHGIELKHSLDKTIIACILHGSHLLVV